MACVENNDEWFQVFAGCSRRTVKSHGSKVTCCFLPSAITRKGEKAANPKLGRRFLALQVRDKSGKLTIASVLSGRFERKNDTALFDKKNNPVNILSTEYSVVYCFGIPKEGWEKDILDPKKPPVDLSKLALHFSRGIVAFLPPLPNQSELEQSFPIVVIQNSNGSPKINVIEQPLCVAPRRSQLTNQNTISHAEDILKSFQGTRFPKKTDETRKTLKDAYQSLRGVCRDLKEILVTG